MRWETPQATDFRYGMEITLYIARRFRRAQRRGVFALSKHPVSPDAP
jgi:coenzyme PQQ precursor peptide PqqA